MGFINKKFLTGLPSNGNGGNGDIRTFSTLTELQNTYPNGSSQPVWVSSEQSWYYWDGVITQPEQDTIAPTVTVSPIGGTYTGNQSVTLTANESATIYYTLDGTTPTQLSSIYSGSINVSSNKTLKYFAKDIAGNTSTVQTSTYTINIPDTTPPADITNLTTSNITETSLTLSWTASVSSDITSYDIYNGATFLTNVTSTTYNVTNLSHSTAYTFNVIAKDSSGNESVGVSVDVTTLVATDTTPPENVTNLTATPAETTVDLSWAVSVSSDVVSYDVFNGATLLGNVTGTTYQVTGLTASTQYAFTVKSKDGSGNIASGSSVTVTTASSVPTPSTEVVHVDGNYLFMPIDELSWSKSTSFSDSTYTAIITSQQSASLFNLSSPSTMMGNSVPYVAYSSFSASNSECYTINNSQVYFKTNIVNGSTSNDVINYFKGKFGNLKLELNPSYGTYNISSNISSVTTRAATNGGQYFKCTLNDGLGTYPAGDKKHINSIGYFMQPDYSWTYADFNLKINSDATLEMVVPSGTLASINQVNVSNYLASTSIKVFY